mgnify:FL=1
MKGLKGYLILFTVLLGISAVYAAVNVNGTDFYLSGTNANITFEKDGNFDSVDVQSNRLVVNGSSIEINGSSGDNTDTVIHDYRPGSDDLLLNFTTESSASQVDFYFEEFSKPEYTIDVNGGEDSLSATGDLKWSYSSWSENRFEVYELSEDPISYSNPRPDSLNSDPDNTKLSLDVSGPSSMDVEFNVYNPSNDLVFTSTDSVSSGSTATASPKGLDPQESYDWNATVSSTNQEVSTPSYSFSTISVDFSWNWSSEGENDVVEGFNVYDSSTESPIEVIDGPDARTTELTQAYFNFGEEYCFQVSAFNSGGESNKTDPSEACVTP